MGSLRSREEGTGPQRFYFHCHHFASCILNKLRRYNAHQETRVVAAAHSPLFLSLSPSAASILNSLSHFLMRQNKLTLAMIEALEFAVAHDGNVRIAQPSVKRTLLLRGYVRNSSGYGWGYSGRHPCDEIELKISLSTPSTQSCVHATRATAK